MLNKSLIGLVLLGLSANAGTIKIAVAANVSYAINDLKKEFNKLHPNTKVRVTLGSSGKLTAQISHGAPYDLFMSANMKYPNTLYKNNIAITKPIIYAKGSLAYLSNKPKDFSKGINLLEDKSIRKIAIANPKTAPYGIASVEALKNAKIYKNIKAKLIYGESIAQTVSYTVTATDIGLIAKSSLFSPKMSHFKENINWKEVDSSLYTPIDQGLVILKQGKENKEVKAFYDFVLSPKAKEIFKTYGYQLP
ncbi:molybdate ABC transporter substrate-binding protein [Poseidonibacter lekithochrous]|uniref:molybdate ABC transporter substrate-binding protein n=1 Tax=Poseidonibacter lekithochrous TaxID=1904463 RepID=UPI0008FCA239|nr:molybdate ABC transporter substrate-binding protein [Poseidonibacter lekithochrous]QKJ22959.1 molybdenum ABC transporter ModABC, periplasmic molybdate-binding protein [Poseidonibacter lekithochrous]